MPSLLEGHCLRSPERLLGRFLDDRILRRRLGLAAVVPTGTAALCEKPDLNYEVWRAALDCSTRKEDARADAFITPPMSRRQMNDSGET